MDAPDISLADEAWLLTGAQSLSPDGVTLLGADEYGVDYVREGIRGRAVFKAGPFLAEAAAAALARLLQDLRTAKPQLHPNREVKTQVQARASDR